jgi:hypothetical protein
MRRVVRDAVEVPSVDALRARVRVHVLLAITAAVCILPAGSAVVFAAALFHGHGAATAAVLTRACFANGSNRRKDRPNVASALLFCVLAAFVVVALITRISSCRLGLLGVAPRAGVVFVAGAFASVVALLAAYRSRDVHDVRAGWFIVVPAIVMLTGIDLSLVGAVRADRICAGVVALLTLRVFLRVGR